MSDPAPLQGDSIEGLVRSIRLDAEPAEITAAFVALSKKARREGLLALEDDVHAIADPNVRRLVQFIIDGSDPDLVRLLARNFAESAAHRVDTYWKTVTQAVTALQQGDNPRVVEELLNSALGSVPRHYSSADAK